MYYQLWSDVQNPWLRGDIIWGMQWYNIASNACQWLWMCEWCTYTALHLVIDDISEIYNALTWLGQQETRDFIMIWEYTATSISLKCTAFCTQCTLWPLQVTAFEIEIWLLGCLGHFKPRSQLQTIAQLYPSKWLIYSEWESSTFRRGRLWRTFWKMKSSLLPLIPPSIAIAVLVHALSQTSCVDFKYIQISKDSFIFSTPI